MIDVCLLGTGGTMPLAERALTALSLRYNGSTFLVDCGEGTQIQLRRGNISMHDIDVILITHFHADHVTGLQGLLLSMAKADRLQPVKIIAPKGAKRIISALCITAPQMPFDVQIIELEQESENFVINGLSITSQLVEHSVICYAYSFALSRKGKFDPESAKKTGADVRQWKNLQMGESVRVGDKIITPDMVMGADRKGLKVTYCTDTRPTDAITELARNSDLLICEGMYADTSKSKMAKEKKHMMFHEATEIAKKSGSKRLWLTHFSPSLPDPYQYSEYAKSLFSETLVPHDLEKTTLNFED